jgi:glutathione S-transferase
MAVEFYHGHGSPYSWRVWLALELKQIPYEVKVLSFQAGDTRKPEFVALNPRHRVPTVVDGSFVVYESTAILEYLDERFDSGVKLFPGNAQDRFRVRRLIRESEEYLDREGIDPITTELFSGEGHVADQAKIDKARVRLGEELQYFSKQLQGEYLAGSQPTAADVVLYPWMGYVKRITFRKPETKLTELVPAPLAAWAKRIEAWPFFDKTFPPHWK